MNSNGVEIPNKQYQQSKDCVDLMRDAYIGSPAVKSDEKRKIYLAPSALNQDWTYEEQTRYKRYVSRAEFDNIPSNTVNSLLGGAFRINPAVELPAQLAAMESNADGDGLELNEMLKIATSELLQMEYVGLLAEYVGMSNLNVDEVSVTDSQNAQPAIKLYTRENIIGWQFSRVNGKLQLSELRLKQCEELSRESGTYETEEIDAYIVLSLDENGYYYQKKYVGGTVDEWSEEYYPLKMGQRFDYIPFEFCIAADYAKGQIPLKMGYVYDIAVKTIARYQTNADLKEALYFSGAPFTTSSGWDSQAQEIYKSMTGHSCIMALPGSHLPMPEGVTFDIKAWSGEGNAIFKYLTQNEAEVRALGGVFDTTDGEAQETATAASIKIAEKQGALTQIVGSVESSFIRVLGYCAEFVGASESTIEMGREFSSSKITPQERDAIRNDYMQGLIGREEALAQLEKGGVLTKDAETIILESSNTIDTLE